MTNLNLYSISNEIRNIQNELIENGGELTPELEEKLKITENQLSTKLLGYNHVLSEMEALEITAKTEIKRLNELVSKKQKVADKLKYAMLQAILEFGTENKGVFSLELGLHKFSTRKSTRIIVDENKISKNEYTYTISIPYLSYEDKEYLIGLLTEYEYNVTEKINKTELKKRIKTEEIEGVESTTLYNLNIK